jgi:hypothetical protein
MKWRKWRREVEVVEAVKCRWVVVWKEEGENGERRRRRRDGGTEGTYKKEERRKETRLLGMVILRI